MKKLVFTFMEDVAIANGKNPDPAELLEKMKLRGKVSDFEDEVRAIRAEYQGALDNLTAQNQAIRDQELTEDEIIFLNFYRERKAKNGEAFQARIDTLEHQLDDTRAGCQKKIDQISQILNG